MPEIDDPAMPQDANDAAMQEVSSVERNNQRRNVKVLLYVVLNAQWPTGLLGVCA